MFDVIDYDVRDGIVVVLLCLVGLKLSFDLMLSVCF